MKYILTKVRTPGGKTKDFPIRIGLHQGSSLSSYLFNLVVDVLNESVKEEVAMCMFFADDIVLLEESREEIYVKLEIYGEIL